MRAAAPEPRGDGPGCWRPLLVAASCWCLPAGAATMPGMSLAQRHDSVRDTVASLRARRPPRPSSSFASVSAGRRPGRTSSGATVTLPAPRAVRARPARRRAPGRGVRGSIRTQWAGDDTSWGDQCSAAPHTPPRASAPLLPSSHGRSTPTMGEMLVPWELRGSLDPRTPSVAVRSSAGSSSHSQLFVRGRPRRDGGRWWEPQHTTAAAASRRPDRRRSYLSLVRESAP
jgi:hypothetical protein